MDLLSWVIFFYFVSIDINLDDNLYIDMSPIGCQAEIILCFVVMVINSCYSVLQSHSSKVE